MSLLRAARRSIVNQHRPGAVTVGTFAKRFMSVTGEDNSEVIEEEEDPIVYEAPFAMLTTRLKAVSISSAIVGAIGVPMLITFYSGDVPAVGQYAVGASTMLAACGSTVAINFCFAPYLHTMERLPVRQCSAPEVEETPEEVADRAGQQYLVKAVWRNFLLMKQETVFDPAIDVTEYKGIRPFCNFVAKEVPMYFHPEILLDDKLRAQLLGEEAAKRYSMPQKENRKDDEDELW